MKGTSLFGHLLVLFCEVGVSKAWCRSWLGTEIINDKVDVDKLCEVTGAKNNIWNFNSLELEK